MFARLMKKYFKNQKVNHYGLMLNIFGFKMHLRKYSFSTFLIFFSPFTIYIKNKMKENLKLHLQRILNMFNVLFCVCECSWSQRINVYQVIKFGTPLNTPDLWQSLDAIWSISRSLNWQKVEITFIILYTITSISAYVNDCSDNTILYESIEFPKL